MAKDARSAAAGVLEVVTRLLADIASTNDAGDRSGPWLRLGEKYWKLAAIVERADDGDLEGIAGIPLSVTALTTIGHAAQAISAAEYGAAFGTKRLRASGGLEESGEALRLLDEVAQGVTAARAMQVFEQFKRIACT
jgi:hypothetical protein